jgi:hypothetical protein
MINKRKKYNTKQINSITSQIPNDHWITINTINTRKKPLDPFRETKSTIRNVMDEFFENNKDFDETKHDLIIKKINGEYKVIVDKKRKEKIDKIFEDDDI